MLRLWSDGEDFPSGFKSLISFSYLFYFVSFLNHKNKSNYITLCVNELNH
jgi:hypothetical protein